MADNNIPESDLIRSYVTWPESEQIFDDGRGGLGFPGQNNSGCTDGTDAEPVSIKLQTNIVYKEDDSDADIKESDLSFTATKSNVNIAPDELTFVCASFTYDKDNNQGEITLAETGIPLAYISHNQGDGAKLIPNTADSLECTNIVASEDNIELTETMDGNVIKFQFTGDAPTEYIWNRDVSVSVVLHLSLGNDSFYAYFTQQNDEEENGVYKYTAGGVERVADHPVPDNDETDDADTNPLLDPTVNDNVPCCKHYRKSYSHREVHDRVYGNVGDVTGFGVKSFASTDCDGSFIDWFTTNGTVNLGNRNGSVYVQGFGLGKMYIPQTARVENKPALPKDTFNENDGTLHPWMTWAYGTRYDSRTETNLPALPRDWPFSDLPSTTERPVFDQLTDTNNITLVKKCSAGVGNLERDIDDDTDPEGQRKLHVYNNRHHIVLYPEYSSIPNTQEAIDKGYTPGTVVVKPLFIHLPATLDTKDGETVDITVSIQNVDQGAFGAYDSPTALSGYRAAMTQPRVYVLGGVQKFSNKKLSVDKDSIEQTDEDSYTLSSSKPAYDKAGELLPPDTEIRANVIIGTTRAVNSKQSVVIHGTIVSNTEADGLVLQVDGVFKDAFGIEIGGHGWADLVLTICGIAYLEVGDNPTDTPMGLEYRYDTVKETSFLAGDIDKDNLTVLNQYNKFYSRHESDRGTDDNGTGMTVLPFTDKRYVLATVYQTATSTFPWAITHRRKLATLAKSWTDELYRDHQNKALMHMVYEENAKLNGIIRKYFDDNNTNEWLRSIDATISPISYMTSKSAQFVWKSLGSVIRVLFPSNAIMPAETSIWGNPVRQARAAVKELVSDFYKMRLLSHETNKQARVKVSGWDIGPRTSWTDSLTETLTPPTYQTSDWTTDLLASAWCCTIRSLPDYVLATDFASYDNPDYPDVDYSTALSALFTQPDTATKWSDYLTSDDFPYNKGAAPQEASACTDESGVESGEPATVTGKPDTFKVFSDNSVILHYAQKPVFRRTADSQKFEHDIRRYAETVLAIKIPENEYMDLSRIKYVTENDMDYIDLAGNKDWMNPFTNIRSIDAVPAPSISSYGNDTPEEFLVIDPVALYRKQVTDDPVTSISTVMPTDSDMAKFLESYVATYAAEMPKHMYQGSRILCKDGVIPSASNDPIYIRAIDRVKKRMFGSESGDTDFIEHYINDNFASITATTRDPNVDRVAVSEAATCISAPPYSPQYLAYNQTYTRVIMQFTFSQKAGRWYTTGYRQYPTNYLSPLYGADALGTKWKSQYTGNGSNSFKVDGDEFDTSAVTMRPLWRNSACAGFNNYRNHMYLPYSMVPPMDITLGCVPYLAGNQTVYDLDSVTPANPGPVRAEYDGSRDDSTEFKPLAPLEEPFRPVNQGGINLYPPANLNGGHLYTTDDGIHANFWSVRRFVRPAVSVLDGTHIPSSDPESPHYGGLLSDPTLYRMFDFPQAGVKDYRIPGTDDPDDDKAKQYLYYHIPNGSPEEDLIAGGTGAPGAFVLGYGISELDQHL